MKQWTKPQLRKILFNWKSSNFRQFSWRSEKVSSFHWLLLEMLLRKTAASQVQRIFPEVQKLIPRPTKLSAAQKRKLKKLIAPLGLSNIRSIAIAEVSEQISAKHFGHVPDTLNGLLELPHVGRYAASATLCFCFNQRLPIVDANIARLYCRLFGYPYPIEIHKAESLWQLAAEILPRKNIKLFNYSLLDFGALICTARNPRCHFCPLKAKCNYFTAQGSRPRRDSQQQQHWRLVALSSMNYP